MKNVRSSKNLRGTSAWQSGISAEHFAAFFLQLKGYRILGRRMRTPFGEVDILAQKGHALVVVEVKSRHRLADSHAAILPDQQRRLMDAGQHLAQRYANISSIRCDAFLFGKGSWPRHIRNAFEE